ncbi:hypothetical protein OEZ85_007199 [Tetradesmus obliquus]|uniref:Protein kinase domain-containing protein n=1 Tax=Tetradesmus obliquus TaxID=3088 RepID=A0ABY8U114_TETOB|nr:hypothetical protein OEZ85_007199 [Tetradesmus obliquus]
MRQLGLDLLLLLLAGLIRASLGLSWPFCEEVLQAGQGFGGAVTITRNCLWKPQVHFVSTITGRLDGADEGPLSVPTIALAPGDIVETSSGPNRVVLNDVVLTNFSLTHPTRDAQVMWPRGLISPGLQPGTTLPRRLYMQDVQLLVDGGTLQQYLRFFTAPGPNNTLVYTDNATFLHIPFWSDDLTFINNVGLLLAPAVGDPAVLALTKPAAGRNYVLAADHATLVPLLQAAGSTSTSIPLLVYIATNVSFGRPEDTAVGLAINRPVYLVGRVTMPTSIDFGMAVNQLVLLGSFSRMTLAQLVLENLAPGDERSVDFAGSDVDVTMGYNMWPMLYPRSSNRLSLHNCTVVLSTLELEEYLYKATLFKVQPAGFPAALASLDAVISSWWVAWLPEHSTVETLQQQSSAMSVLSCNYTSTPLIAPRLPLPMRFDNGSSPQQPQSASGSDQHSLTHVDASGVKGPLPRGSVVGPSSNSSSATEMVLLTTNMSFGISSSSSPVVEQQLRQHLSAAGDSNPLLRHTLMGIADPPVTLDMGYSTDFVVLGPDAAPGQLSIINLAMLRLSQGPAAFLPSANLQTPEVWTHLLWSIPRPRGSATVWVSNVTLWVPAAEYSYIRSHTGDSDTNFTIDLTGGQQMQFSNVVDRRAQGVYVGNYKGPGLQGSSLWLRLEAGWGQDSSGPRGFWNTATAQHSGRMSDAVVVVLAVCLVTAVVASVLACLAVVLWRKRAAEARLAAAAMAAAEQGKAGLGPSMHGDQAPSQRSSGSAEREQGGSGSAARLELSLQEPVHDSSDSYPLQDRALLTAELARSQLLGNRRSRHEGGSEDGDSGVGLWQQQQQGLRQPPPAAVANAASDAALQRLHSAITTMSQDVLSRRLQVSSGNALSGQSSGASTAGGAGPLSRPSPLGLARESPHAHFLQQQQQQQQQPQDGRASGSFGAAGAASDVSSQKSLPAQDAAAAAGDAAEADDAAAAAAAQQQQQQGRPVSNSGSMARVSHPGSNMLGELKLLQLVGQGTFGQVYKALWRRRCVAVKVLQLPATAGNSDVSPWAGVARVSSHREKMAVMETVVSTTMSHPNIVQVYTASAVRSVHADSTASSRQHARADGGGSSSSSDAGDAEHKPVLVGWELRLVMEFCDAGSLRTALDHKLLIDRTTGLPALECVLFLAHDVACAMIHLHSEHLLHGDLKASNVLLKRTAPRLPVWPEQAAAAAAAAGGHGRRTGQLVGLGLGLMAKVADFGLSLTLGPADTHVSQMHMGTLTHMAPELLLHGHASRASDVYAYGILLWELATGRRPYSGTPVGMLAHKVAQQGWRPAWPGGCCEPVQALTEMCWAQDPADRPSFDAIVAQLEDMAGQLDALKQQQAQQMAAAAAPLCAAGTASHPEVGELGHELTPSMMADLMPSGFSGGSGQHEQMQQEGGSGTALYEMSQLSCGSDREHQQH